MPVDPETDKLDTDIAEALADVFGQMVEHLETVSRRFALPSFCVKALHMLGSPMTMKQLGQRFHCDPSFVTAIADMLDSHGLGRREPDTRDRRIKHLRLTPKGLEIRQRLERELLDRMPWTGALEVSERECLLGLLQKMTRPKSDQPGCLDPALVGTSTSLSADEPVVTSQGSSDITITPPAKTGGYRAGEVAEDLTPVVRDGS